MVSISESRMKAMSNFDEAINDAITHTHKKGLPETGLMAILKGLVLWTPIGGYVYGHQHKLVFDKVWARRQEWLARPLETEIQEEEEEETDAFDKTQ